MGFYKLYSTIQGYRTFWKGLFPNSSDKGKEVGCVPLGSAGEGIACPCALVAAGGGIHCPKTLMEAQLLSRGGVFLPLPRTPPVLKSAAGCEEQTKGEMNPAGAQLGLNPGTQKE